MAPVAIPRWAGNTGPADLFNVLFASLGAAVLWKSRNRLAMPLGLSYLLILLGGIIAMANSVLPADSLLGIAQDAYLFLWFLIAVNLLSFDSAALWRTVCLAWALTAAAEGFLAWLLSSSYTFTSSILGYPTEKAGGRALGTFRDPNMAANYLVLSLFILWAAPRPASRKGKWLLTMPILLGILATQSNTAFVALAGGVLIALTVNFIARREAVVATGLAILGVVVMLVATFPVLGWHSIERTTRSLGKVDAFSLSLSRAGGSLERRWERWQDTIRFVGGNVLIGVGPRSADDALEESGYADAAEIHNDYLAAFIERGLIGGLGVLLLFAVASAWTLRVSFSTEVKKEGWSTAWLAGGMMGMILSAITLETLHFRHAWMFLAVVIGLGLSHSSGGLNIPLDPRRPRYAPSLALTRSATSPMDIDRSP